MRGNGKRESQVHASRIALDGCIDKLLDLREGYDFIEVSGDLVSLHSENRAIQIDVLATGEFLMKSDAHFQQRADTAIYFSVAFSWFGDAGENFEQCAFAG